MTRINSSINHPFWRACISGTFGLGFIYFYQPDFRTPNKALTATQELAKKNLAKQVEQIKKKYRFNRLEPTEPLNIENCTVCPSNQNFKAGFVINNIKNNPIACQVIEEKILDRIDAFQRFIDRRGGDASLGNCVEKIQFCLDLDKEALNKQVTYEAVKIK